MRRMLPVGVHPPAVGVVVLERPPIAGRDAESQPQVRAERMHLRAVSRATSAVRSVDPSSTTSTSASGSSARSASSTAGRLSSSFHAGMKTRCRAHGRSSSARAARSCRRMTVSAPSSQATAPGVGKTGASSKPDRDSVRLVDAAEDPARPEEMQWRADHDGLGHAAFEQERQRARGVLGGGRCGLLGDELERRAVPEPAHLLGLGRPAVGSPAREHDQARIDPARKAPRFRDEPAAGAADAVRAVTSEQTVAGHDEGEGAHGLQATSPVQPVAARPSTSPLR